MGQIVLWVGVMVGALVVLAVVLMALRRRLLAPARAPEAGMFDHLRRMRQEGSITTEEYDAIRQRIVSRLAGNESHPRNESQAGNESHLADESPARSDPRTDSPGVDRSERVDSSQPRQPPID